MSGNTQGQSCETRISVLENEHQHFQRNQDAILQTLKTLSETCQQISINIGRMADYERDQEILKEDHREIRKDIQNIVSKIPDELPLRLAEIETSMPGLKEVRAWILLGLGAGFLGICSFIFQYFTKII
jgi:chromosome segregation ATPase